MKFKVNMEKCTGIKRSIISTIPSKRDKVYVPVRNTSKTYTMQVCIGTNWNAQKPTLN